MADHVRQQVRDAIKTILRAAGTRAGLEWYPARTRPVDTNTENMPVGFIHTPTERAVADTMAPRGSRTMDRMIDVQLEMFEQPDTPDVLDKLDTLCKETENALLADATLGGVCRDINGGEGFTTSISLTHEAAGDTAVAVLRFVVRMTTVEGAVDVAV